MTLNDEQIRTLGSLIFFNLVRIYGIIAFISSWESLENYPLLKYVLIVNFAVGYGIRLPYNIWNIIKVQLNPLVRQRYKLASQIILCGILIYDLIVWGLLLYCAISFGETTGMNIPLRIYVYFLFSYSSLIYTFLFWVITFYLSVVLFLSCCRLCGIYTEDHEPGNLHLDKTKVETIADLVGVEKDQKCSICLEIYQEKDQIRKLPCNHFFHVDCLKPWFKTKNTCPMCKQRVQKAVSVYSTDNDPENN